MNYSDSQKGGPINTNPTYDRNGNTMNIKQGTPLNLPKIVSNHIALW